MLARLTEAITKAGEQHPPDRGRDLRDRARLDRGGGRGARTAGTWRSCAQARARVPGVLRGGARGWRALATARRRERPAPEAAAAGYDLRSAALRAVQRRTGGFCILPLRRQRVQTRTCATAPSIERPHARRFGSQVREVTLWAWLTLRPVTVRLAADLALLCHDSIAPESSEGCIEPIGYGRSEHRDCRKR